MNADNSTGRPIMNLRTRWIAGITGIFAVIFSCVVVAPNTIKTGWSQSHWYEIGAFLIWLVIPAFVAIGAIVAGKWQRAGTNLVAVGMVFASAFFAPYATAFTLSQGPGDLLYLSLQVLAALTVLLILLSDVMLIMRARSRPSHWAT